MGVAVAAPRMRRAVGWTTGLSQVILGAAEDYVALRLGTEAMGMPMQEVTCAAREAVEHLRDGFPTESPSAARWESGSSGAFGRSQSAGAGSM
jgi:hypothetical protein